MVDQTRRLSPAQIEADRASFAALQAIQGYAPANAAYSVTAITAAQGNLSSAQTTESQAEAAAASARDTAVAREWEFHDLMLGAKDQVVAQYGRNSNEVQSLGLTKKEERKAPQRAKKTREPSK
jgi:hypothetical protein